MRADDPERLEPPTTIDTRYAKGMQVGDGGTQINEFHLPKREVDWPHRIGVVPPPADCRQDRPADHDLDTATTKGGTVVVCQVLTGLGGVGKTQLAAGLARRMWERRKVDLLVWVTATSRQSIVTSFAQAAADITGVEDTDPTQGAARFLAWLAGTERRWLVVLDDLTTPKDLNGLWPPTTATGRTVVTTRRRDATLTNGRQVVQVGLFTPAESAQYLRDKLNNDPVRLDQADELAADLGHLPLALAQAAAYLLDRGLTCAAYRKRLADQRRRLPDVVPEAGALPDDHQNTIAATWSLSIDLADQLNPVGLARPTLELAALLDPNAIPINLFTANATLGYLTQRRNAGQPVDADDAIDALHCLQRLNLITLDQANGTVRVHGLVQRAVREATPTEHTAMLATTAADALVEIWPDVERDRELGQLLRANAIALNTHSGALLWNSDTGGHRVLFTAGRSLGKAGLVTAAADYFHTLHTTAQHHLGPNHPHTLATRAHLANWQGKAGDPTTAANALAELLTDQLRILGPNHPHTLGTRNNLAHWRGQAGNPTTAANALAELLTDQLHILEPNHPHTLTTRNNLANWQGKAGDPTTAANALAELLTDQLHILEPNHPDTLTTRNNLANWQGKAGDPTTAANALAELLTDQLRILGPNHPHTLGTRNNLAHWRGQAGDPTTAANALAELLTDRLRILGPDHPHTLTTRAHLAYWESQLPKEPSEEGLSETNLESG